MLACMLIPMLTCAWEWMQKAGSRIRQNVAIFKTFILLCFEISRMSLVKGMPFVNRQLYELKI